MSSDQTWHPYAPDQAFGRAIANDEELLDQLLLTLDAAVHEPLPRAGNKASIHRPPPSPLPLAAWLGAVIGKGVDGPVTTATALEAATDLHDRDGPHPT
jgi:hypothetical protein